MATTKTTTNCVDELTGMPLIPTDIQYAITIKTEGLIPQVMHYRNKQCAVDRLAEITQLLEANEYRHQYTKTKHTTVYYNTDADKIVKVTMRPVIITAFLSEIKLI